MSSVSQQLEGAPRTSSLDTQPPTNPIREYHVVNPHTLPAKIREIPDKAIQGVAMFFYVIGNILTVGLLFGIDYAVNKVQADVVKKLETELRKMIQDDLDENEDQGATSSDENNAKISKLGEKLLDAKLALTKVNSPISDKDALERVLQEYKIDKTILNEMKKISSGEKKDDTDVFVGIYMHDEISEIIEARLNDLEISRLEIYIDELKNQIKSYYEDVTSTSAIQPAGLKWTVEEIVKSSLEIVKLQSKYTESNDLAALKIIEKKFNMELVIENIALSGRVKENDMTIHVNTPKAKALNMIIGYITRRINLLVRN